MTDRKASLNLFRCLRKKKTIRNKRETATKLHNTADIYIVRMRAFGGRNYKYRNPYTNNNFSKLKNLLREAERI